MQLKAFTARTYKAQFYLPQPHIHAVLRILLETLTKINSICQNSIKSQTGKNVIKLELNIKTFSQNSKYKNSESLIL